MGILAFTMPLMHVQADDFFDDDIYYNPTKEKNVAKQTSSSYIANFDELDVDTYNRRGQYYVSPIDTVGERIGMEEDFVYTQQLQKFYNPTIVVENADVLADVLENSYGNVDIVIDNGNLNFAPAYLSNRYYGFYSPWAWSYNPWSWGAAYYDPWYGPWGWGPSYSWYSWYSSWSWGPGWNWGWGPTYIVPVVAHRPAGNRRPAGNHRVGAAPGWASANRPSVGHRTLNGSTAGSTRRPGSMTGVSNYGQRPGGNQRGYVENTTPSRNHITNSSSEHVGNTVPSRNPMTNSSNNHGVQTEQRTNSSRNNYTPSRNTGQNRSGYNSGMNGSSRSSGSFGGSRGGGGGRGGRR